jgi:uncharacterized protein YqeY
MTIEMLEQERNLARKNGNNKRLLVLNDIIAKARAKETAGKKKIELTEQLVNDTLVEYRKMLKDGIKQMPEGHAVRAMYEDQMTILEEFCPPVLEDEIQIENLIVKTLYSNNIEVSHKNKGKMMKALMPALRAQYADMDIAMPIIDFLISNAEAVS